MLVANGHSWLSIKKYTLSEVGAFYRSVIKREKTKDTELLSLIWMGTHCSDQKTFQGIINDMSPRQEREISPSQSVINDDWKRLASLRLN